MAAPYRIYLKDWLAQSGSATASHNSADSLLLTDVDQTSLWLPGNAGPNVSWSGQLVATADIIGVGFGNCHLVEGETIQIWKGSSLGAETTLLKTISSAPASRNWVAVFAENNLQFIKIKFTSSISTSLQIGTISALGADERIVFNAGNGPLRRSINRSVMAGVVVTPLAPGSEVHQIIAGPENLYGFTFVNLDATEGAAWDDLLDSIDTYQSWSRGVWITDDGFNDTTGLGRGIYCRLLPSTPAQGVINNAGPQGSVSLMVKAMNEGIRS